ncbi:hypothetical protein MMC22_003466 [Lobaria immixta]|nr:hypothetical protein [Lobaria immixta]
MAEPNNSAIDNETGPGDTTPADTGPDDMAPQDQPVSNIANQPTSSIIARRNWILYLPPEVRLVIYDYVLQIPHCLPYDLQMLWVHPAVRSRTSILRTSDLLRREGIDVFFRVNTFSIGMILPLFQTVPRRIGDMIQNIDIHIEISVHLLGARDLFIGIIQTFGFVLGPARPHAGGNGLTFFPQRFLRANAQPTRENVNWMDHLDGVCLDWNEEGIIADCTADESEPPTQNSSSQG